MDEQNNKMFYCMIKTERNNQIKRIIKHKEEYYPHLGFPAYFLEMASNMTINDPRIKQSAKMSEEDEARIRR